MEFGGIFFEAQSRIISRQRLVILPQPDIEVAKTIPAGKIVWILADNLLKTGGGLDNIPSHERLNPPLQQLRCGVRFHISCFRSISNCERKATSIRSITSSQSPRRD